MNVCFFFQDIFLKNFRCSKNVSAYYSMWGFFPIVRIETSYI